MHTHCEIHKLHSREWRVKEREAIATMAMVKPITEFLEWNVAQKKSTVDDIGKRHMLSLFKSHAQKETLSRGTFNSPKMTTMTTMKIRLRK